MAKFAQGKARGITVHKPATSKDLSQPKKSGRPMNGSVTNTTFSAAPKTR